MTRHATNLTTLGVCLTFALTFALTQMLTDGAALAQQPAPPAAKPSDILPDRPDADPEQAADLLGPEFDSRGHGISLRPPKDSVAQRRVGSQEIVEFVNESKGWTLKLSKIVLAKPGSLTEWRDAQGHVQPGVMEFTATRLKEEIPDVQFLRQEKVAIGDGDVGMLALRYTKNLKSLLTQQAIIQRTDQMYYLLALTTPGSPKGTANEKASAGERMAVETFRQVLDSVKLLDLRAVRQDQDQRLFRTRGLLVNFTPDRLRAALVPQQWHRILRNGKDIGYTYLEERTETKGAQEGVEVRVRTRVLPGQDVQVDVGTIMFASMDLRHEDWSTLSENASIRQRAAQKDYRPPQLSESGVSDRRSVPGSGDVYGLQVLYESTRERVEPLVRDLPPFYLPQAMSHLLPRLVPLGEPKTFMFMVYVTDTREVMARYVDVLEARKVTFNNKLVRAVPVEDRVGLEGAVTTHYMDIDGIWIGSETKGAGVIVIPSDKDSLLAIWKDANLTPPEAPALQKPGAAPQAAKAAAPVDRKSRPAQGSETPNRAPPGERLGTPGTRR